MTATDPYTAAKLAAKAQAVVDLSAEGFRSFFGEDLRGVNLALQKLAGINLRHCRLEKADFRNADLRRVNFGYVAAQDTDFRGADLTGANFFGADLRRADFTGANLTDAFLFGALVEGAIFTDATLPVINAIEDFTRGKAIDLDRGDQSAPPVRIQGGAT